ncbi:hypothetical protein [Mangrovibacterium diazotrophicum]|uniref:Uncharacterized protein n=1 Tax=Mangrovibacterium diazotrophicum TaxID=1261403 RepID=A0A419VXI3_9BACT|nr:hypothetical protein [Mangrovibacterium diazotrophicum]RKD87933.1 hypothetical protein BC643_3941 [Mangrovibacterium diazotrophicum]
MKSQTKLKILASSGLLIISVLPLISKELFIAANGHLKTPMADPLLPLLFIVGLFLNWKYIPQILISILGIIFLVSAFMLVGTMASSASPFRPGWIIFILCSILSILSLFQITKPTGQN